MKHCIPALLQTRTAALLAENTLELGRVKEVVLDDTRNLLALVGSAPLRCLSCRPASTHTLVEAHNGGDVGDLPLGAGLVLGVLPPIAGSVANRTSSARPTHSVLSPTQ